MLWSNVRAWFPNQWVQVIPFHPYEKRGKVYIDEVAIVDVGIDATPEEEGLSDAHGYYTLICHTDRRYIELDPGVLPDDSVARFGLLEMIQERGFAIGMLQAGCSVEQVSDHLHIPIMDLRKIMAKRVEDHPWLLQSMRDAGMSNDEIVRDTGLSGEELEEMTRNCTPSDES